jgi:hypothetical protein
MELPGRARATAVAPWLSRRRVLSGAESSELESSSSSLRFAGWLEDLGVGSGLRTGAAVL